MRDSEIENKSREKELETYRQRKKGWQTFRVSLQGLDISFRLVSTHNPPASDSSVQTTGFQSRDRLHGSDFTERGKQ